MRFADPVGRLRWLCGVALAAAAVSSAVAQPPAAPTAAGSQPAERIDRIVAVVNDDPILDSDLDRVIALELARPQPEETKGEFRNRVLVQLIEERLRFQEIDRFGFSDVPLEAVEAGFEEIRSRFGGSAGFAQRLEDLGLDERELRNMVARQIMVMTFVEERLGPRVFVDLDDIRAYYDNVLVPELGARGEEVPPVEAVREQIRAVLKEDRLNRELRQWTEELRQEADIEEYLEPQAESLPPRPG